MKAKVLLFLSSLVCLFCLSCQNDEDNSIEGNYPPPSLEKTLLDGGSISSIDLYCLQYHDTIFGLSEQERYSMIKTVPDYSSFYLLLMLNLDNYLYSWNGEYNEEIISIKNIIKEYEDEKSAFIYEEYETYTQSVSEVGWPYLVTAFTNGEVSITCDKVLYGEQPGTNLSSHFTVLTESACLPVGIENPKLLYHFGDELPKIMSDYFVDKSWLQPKYYLQFSEEVPCEKYDELTLHLSYPMIIESFWKRAVAEYKGIEFNERFTEAEFNADCTIRFNWGK